MPASKIEGKWGRDPAPSGYNPNTNSKFWCYMCDDTHPWEEPCKELMKLRWVRKEFSGRS